MCLFAVKRKKAILSDSEDEDEEKADKPGKRPSAFKALTLPPCTWVIDISDTVKYGRLLERGFR